MTLYPKDRERLVEAIMFVFGLAWKAFVVMSLASTLINAGMLFGMDRSTAALGTLGTFLFAGLEMSMKARDKQNELILTALREWRDEWRNRSY